MIDEPQCAKSIRSQKCCRLIDRNKCSVFAALSAIILLIERMPRWKVIKLAAFSFFFTHSLSLAANDLYQSASQSLELLEKLSGS